MRIILLYLGFLISVTSFSQINGGLNKNDVNDPLRPQFHFTADSNFLSDPNGLLYFKGRYHLFHQYNPYDTKSGVPQHWGHAVSSDVVHWKRLPIAIFPHGGGNIWSGSAIVDKNNTSGVQSGMDPPIVAFYTWQKDFTQRMIYSNDEGNTWTEYKQNPVVEHLFVNNRDPKVFWYEPTRKWIMVLYTNDFEIFVSDNLKQWEHASYMNLQDFHECPDFFELPVDGNENNMKWVVIDARGSYYIGNFDGIRFTPEDGPFLSDYNGLNKIFYATQTFNNMPQEDGRRIQIACMRDRNSKIPWQQFCNQMTFPCELSLRTTDEGIRLFRNPIREIEKLYSIQHKWNSEEVLPETKFKFSDFDLLDINAIIKPGKASKISFVIRGVPVEYDINNHEIKCEGVTAPMKTGSNNKIELRIIADRISFEIFGNDGEVSLSVYVNPSPSDIASYIKVSGGIVELVKLEVAELKSIQF